MNWYEELKKAMEYRGDSFENKVSTLTDEELRIEFDGGFGGVKGAAFTAWGEKWVYFPIVYDGAEWIGSAPRNPCKISMRHQGGQ